MKSIEDFLINFIEKETDVFSGYPVCPFAKKERVGNKIKFVTTSFKSIQAENVLAEAVDFLNKSYSTLLFISDDKPSYIETKYFFKCIATLLKDKCNIFLFHEEDKRSYGGLYTRRSPEPFIMVGYKKHIKHKKKQLLKTEYYKKLTKEELLQLHPKRKKTWEKLKK
tara:strand:+ start:84 stop:584 length:501 start_codon:yes stop_codon:yes gene_type:complete